MIIVGLCSISFSDTYKKSNLKIVMVSDQKSPNDSPTEATFILKSEIGVYVYIDGEEKVLEEFGESSDLEKKHKGNYKFSKKFTHKPSEAAEFKFTPISKSPCIKDSLVEKHPIEISEFKKIIFLTVEDIKKNDTVAPVIESEHIIQNKDDFTFRVKITDDTCVENVVLILKRGTLAEENIQLIQEGDSEWWSNRDITIVEDRFQYKIEAKDVVVRSPHADFKDHLPDRQVPEISNIVFQKLNKGRIVNLSVDVKDNKGIEGKPSFFYFKDNMQVEKTLEHGPDKKNYQTSIEPDSGIFKYYISASDINGYSSRYPRSQYNQAIIDTIGPVLENDPTFTRDNTSPNSHTAVFTLKDSSFIIDSPLFFFKDYRDSTCFDSVLCSNPRDSIYTVTFTSTSDTVEYFISATDIWGNKSKSGEPKLYAVPHASPIIDSVYFSQNLKNINCYVKFKDALNILTVVLNKVDSSTREVESLQFEKSDQSENLYQIEIPCEFIPKSNVLTYFVSATDSSDSSDTYGSLQQPQMKLLDITAPEIKCTVKAIKANGKKGAELSITIVDSSAITRVEVYAKNKNGIFESPKQPEKKTEKDYILTIDNVPRKLEYYIKATDSIGFEGTLGKEEEPIEKVLWKDCKGVLLTSASVVAILSGVVWGLTHEPDEKKEDLGEPPSPPAFRE